MYSSRAPIGCQVIFCEYQMGSEFALNIDEEECRRFFNILNSQEYAAAKQKMPVQYLMKVGAESHQGKGVEVLDEKLEAEITLTYASGSLCGIVNEDMIAQKYIANPLLIYDRQKFDFRVYVLIASMNPLIAYYRDGFVRVSLQKYDAQTSEVTKEN